MSSSAYVPMLWHPLNDTISPNPKAKPVRIIFWNGGALPIMGTSGASCTLTLNFTGTGSGTYRIVGSPGPGSRLIFNFSSGAPEFHRIVGALNTSQTTDKLTLNFSRFIQ